jgi:hypothetical protein
MSVVQSLQPRRLLLAAGVLFVAAIAACDRSPTAPGSALSKSTARAYTIEGDTTSCRNGWIVVQGRYQCN